MQTGICFNAGLQAAANEASPSFEVLIVYDDVDAERRAMQLCSYLGHEHSEVEFHVHPWRFDLLEHPDWAATATADGHTADLFIIATSDGSDLPAHVRSWMRSCLAQKRGGGALVALLGAERRVDPDDSPRLLFLKNVARDAGLDFFVPMPRFEDALLRAAQVPASWLDAPKQSVTRTFFHPTVDHRHWGIND